jgi:hypothetical protein
MIRRDFCIYKVGTEVRDVRLFQVGTLYVS